ncbi:MAG TPA: hypothetical protein VKR62_16515 [Roseiarcus sp.]|nr:hypothetical protein [Roseiarcus sp.]
MLLVLCDENDAPALWAAEALRERGLSPTVLTGADLAAAKRWEHRVGAGTAACEILLGDGAVLRSRDVHAVLNRLPTVPWTWQRRIGGADRDYAIQEMYAFYLSWLHGLPGRKLNPPTPQGLCGNPRHPSVWAALAARAGLPARPFRQTSADDPERHWRETAPSAATLNVVGTRVVGPESLVRSQGDACLRLSRAAGAPLIGVDFATDPDGAWRMTGVSIMPDLSRNGPELADALAEELAP